MKPAIRYNALRTRAPRLPLAFRALAGALTAFLLIVAQADQCLAQGKRKIDRRKALEMLEYDSSLFMKKKDPLFAGMLSWYIPGLGHYYSEEYLKGTVFMVTEYGLMITAIVSFIDFDFSAGGGSGFQMRLDSSEANLGAFKIPRRTIFWGTMVIVGIMHLYSVSDAVLSARSYNERLEKKRIRWKEKYPDIDFSYDGKKDLYIGFRTEF